MAKTRLSVRLLDFLIFGVEAVHLLEVHQDPGEGSEVSPWVLEQAGDPSRTQGCGARVQVTRTDASFVS